MLDTWLFIYEVVHIAFDRTYITDWKKFGIRISVQDVSLLVDAKHYGANILTFDQQVLQLEKTFTL